MEDDSYFEDEDFSPVKSILGLLTFSTIFCFFKYDNIGFLLNIDIPPVICSIMLKFCELFVPSS